jgi:hypothetical protein
MVMPAISTAALKVGEKQHVVGHQPAQRPPGDGCYLGENLAAHAMTNFAERGSLGIRQLQPTFQLGLQDAAFGSQIFVSRQQLLVHRPRDVGQDARQIRESPLPSNPRWAPSIVAKE